jgi:hypothetical protein
MANIKKIVLGLLLCVPLTLVSGLAQAQQDFPKDITVSWTNPEMYVDGTVIETGDLDAIRIEIYRQNDTVPTFTATVPDNGEGAAQSQVFAAAIPNPGTYRIEGYAIVVGGEESDASESAFKKYTGKPRAITFVTVE